ncbi:GUB_WAK_bind domain-containing protein [Psidium guajava]|nr:GUB_WAK_bind domain-containing protein [Psidium guajava]
MNPNEGLLASVLTSSSQVITRYARAYSVTISQALGWPFLTVDWTPLPPQPFDDEPSLAVNCLVLGIHTSDGVPNFLLLADAHLPAKSDRSSDI